MKKLLKRAARMLGYEIRAIEPSPPEEFVLEAMPFEHELLRSSRPGRRNLPPRRRKPKRCASST